MSLEMLVESIDQVADTMERFAKDIRRCSKNLKDSGDIIYATEALSAIKNCYGNILIDRIATRIIRELQK